MNGELVRFAYLSTATLGWMSFDGIRLATIERPWIPNPDGLGGKPRMSCIPDGRYTVIPHHSDRFPGTYALVNHASGVYYQPGDIPDGQAGRSAILIHVGNYVSDVVGCIAVGMRHAHDKLMVVDSRVALEKLRAVLARDKHSLTIRPIAGTQEVA